MSIEFQGSIPNLENIILKPKFSWGVLVTTNFPSSDENSEEWTEKVNLLLQHGVDVLLSKGKGKTQKIEGYNLFYTPDSFDFESLNTFLTSNNIRVLDGSTR